MEYQNEQFSYDNWSQNSPANKQEMFCGGDLISTNEKYFINTYAKSNCLDVGCGTGNRTFLYYESHESHDEAMKALGIEKFPTSEKEKFVSHKELNKFIEAIDAKAAQKMIVTELMHLLKEFRKLKLNQ